ncbi:gluconokinase [Pararhizobium sp.]|uniref:gluconokinase n=1 Tax=Pararhizobium sp. TaxID=1977563 RepID=UPI0027208AC4|nr:gluconokinase [Pararhizobium sp.]MDO9416113.1 gluconokinase [Pararhizobium sp.]
MSTAALQPAFKGPIVVMGVSGCGKSSVGERLAEHLGLPYVEGDSLHPAANIEKMSKGIPLDDADRWPWLDIIGQRLAAAGPAGTVISCSALKRTYRDRLRQAAGRPLAFVFLKGSREILLARMTARPGHFFKAPLLDSQLATLESPEGEDRVVTVDIAPSPDSITETALEGLAALSGVQP